MKRYRLPLILLLTLTVALLFLGDYLTGRVRHEFQNPYSRTSRVVESKFGFTHEDVIPHTGMSALYYDQLKQPRKDLWEPSSNSFKIERFTGRMVYEKRPLAPIMQLEPDMELVFLQSLPNDAIRFAVLKSLFQPRRPETQPDAALWNEHLALLESKRVKTVYLWYKMVRDNPAIIPQQWWHQNAARFGLRPDGTALNPSPPAISQGESKGETARN